jgi:hypothetical protein
MILIILNYNYVGSKSMDLVTNSSKFLKYKRKVDTVTLIVYRSAHKCFERLRIGLDFIIFSEHI